MSDSAKCPRCQADLPLNFPTGLCPACLMQQGLFNSTFTGEGRSSSGGGRSGRHPRWTPPTPAELAPRFPQLEIVELIGQGGMGAVYKVRQKDLDRWAALKILPDDVAHDPNFSDRFQREARALALLGHQHIVIVYEFGQRDGVYFLLMEFIDGVTLRQAIRAGQISAKDALGIVAQICDALQFAHEEGVVHRDIKPENILIDKRGRVKIADFGLAKLLGVGSIESPTLTGTHQVMGTPMYMAPEQMEGTRGVDHRADIFSLGVVFYELLTGELPLGRFAPPSQKYQLDIRLDDVVLRTLEKEPNRRYQQASDVKCDVESIRSHPPIEPLRTLERPRGRFLRKLLVSTLMGLVCLGAVLFFTARITDSFLKLKSERNQLLTQLQHTRTQAIREAQALNEARLIATQRNENPHPPLEAVDSDPNEVNAIVQFTAEGAKLHQDFGANELSAEHRKFVNQLINQLHKEYFAIQSDLTERETTSDGKHIIIIRRPLESQISLLENRLWTEIDSELPVEQQRFLRQNLPLFADAQKPLPLVTNIGGRPRMMGASNGGAQMGMMSSMSMMGAAAMPMTSSVTPFSDGYQLRYAQLFGWKSSVLPLRITISRRGKWFQWLIEMGNRDYPILPTYLPTSSINPDCFGLVDSGEAPQLPSGLRLFWNEASVLPVTTPAAASLGDSSSGEDDGFAPSRDFRGDALPKFLAGIPEPNTEIFSIPNGGRERVETVDLDSNQPPQSIENPNSEKAVMFDEHEVPSINPAFGEGLLTEEDREHLNEILPRFRQQFLELERQHTAWKRESDGTLVARIEKFEDELSVLLDQLWTAIDGQLSTEQQSFLRERLPLIANFQKPPEKPKFDSEGEPLPVDKAPTILRSLHLFGWSQDKTSDADLSPRITEKFPMRVTINRQGKWYRWTIEVFDRNEPRKSDSGVVVAVEKFLIVDSGNDPELPPSIRHLLRNDVEVAQSRKSLKTDGTDHPVEVEVDPSGQSDNSLDEALREIDGLRNGDETRWEEVERRINELLAFADNISPGDKKARVLGRIHWQAAHIYRQSELRVHSADVAHHAKLALKYERDPSKRGWLYMYLGSACEVGEDDPARLGERRAEATRWYLRGYAELIPFKLPDVAPEVASLGIKIDAETEADGVLDPDQVSLEVRRTAQRRTLRELEFVRELVHRRDAYISSLKQLFTRMDEIYGKDANSKERLTALASEVLGHEEIEKLVPLVLPKHDEKAFESPSGTN